MTNFIEGCKCKGRRPKGIAESRHVLRPEITGRLIQNRNVPRFIIAPGGYGKTAVAHEYAQVVFGYEHTFWINCASPCFLRDLDEGGLAQQIKASDSEARLVICDEVPALEDDRRAAFDEFIDDVLGFGCELLATFAPANFSMTSQRNALVLRGIDLLLTDDELEVERMRGNSYALSSSIPFSERAACLFWSKTGVKTLLSGFAKETNPCELKLCAFVALALGRGSVNDFECVLRGCAEEIAALLESAYPFLGIEMKSGYFKTLDLSFPDISSMLRPKLDELASVSCFVDENELSMHLAKSMLVRGDVSRACEFVSVFATKEAKIEWIRRFGEASLINGEVVGVAKLCSAVRFCPKSVQAWAFYILGDEKAARKYIKRTTKAEDRDILSSLVLRGYLDRDIDVFTNVLELASLNDFGEPRFEPAGIDWGLLCRLMAQETEMSGDDFDEFAFDTLLLASAWRLEFAAEEDVQPLALRLNMLLEKAGSTPQMIVLACVNALEKAHFSEQIRHDVKSVAYRMRTSLDKQIEEFNRWQTNLKRAKSGYGKNDVSISGAPGRSSFRHAPTLTVALFGGLDVRIGEGMDSARTLNRQRAKIALAELAINRGREISWDKLTGMLWPETDPDFRKRNFYVIWGYLKKALSVDGECPYLIRTQTGFKLDERNLACDIDAFDSLCRSLLFGGSYSWEEMFEKVTRDFSNEFLPDVHGNDHVDSLRRVYKEQLVDGLIAAAVRLGSEGENHGSLWFAREALRRDELREDSYIALMEAQIASNQRGAAIDTYFECRRALSERLGIDPSPEVVRIYDSIISV